MPVKDNTLYESATGSLSNGIGHFMFSGTTNTGDLRRALVAFDIAGNVDAGSTINSVTLTLHMSRTAATTSRTIGLHEVSDDWGEGTSNATVRGGGGGAASTTGDATWIHRFFDTLDWAAAGGDFSGTSSATAAVGAIGFYNWSSAAMVSDVQGWLDTPSTNFGWLLLGDESASTTAKRFDTRENLTAANRPVLTVDFTPPPTTPDIQISSATADGFTDLEVAYNIVDGPSDPFEIGFYRSSNTTFGGDTLLDAVLIDSAADLSTGLHTKTFTIGAGAGEIALPGAGAAEIDSDYHILAVADHLNSVVEVDANPFTEDNTAVFEGVYHVAAGDVLIQATSGSDLLVISATGLTVNLNGATSGYVAADVQEFRARLHAGNDAATAATISKPVHFLGGTGSDNLIGGNGDDVLDGESGNDSVNGGLGSDTLLGGTGSDLWILAGSAGSDSIGVDGDGASGLIGNVGADSTTVSNVESLRVEGRDGADTIDMTALDPTEGADAGLTAVTLQGNAGGDAMVIGESGLIVLTEGGDGNDTVTGSLQADVIHGGLDDDQVFGRGGDDTIDGGDGNDLLRGQAGNDLLMGGIGNDQLTGEDGPDTLMGEDGDDFLRGDNGADSLLGGEGNDKLRGNNGPDILFGDAGDDSLLGQANADSLVGGDGNDQFSGPPDARDDTLDGGPGIDFWSWKGSAENESFVIDFIPAGPGVPAHLEAQRSLRAGPALQESEFVLGIESLLVTALRGFDVIDLSQLDLADLAAAGVTAISVNPGGNGDTVFGSDGDDTIIASGGRDELHGGEGNDFINDGAGSGDSIFGEGGDDILRLRKLNDGFIDGGAGNDEVDATRSQGNNTLLGGDGDDSVWGGTGNDSLDGGIGADTLDGGAGNDTLAGDAGDDSLAGGEGDDQLDGGTGSDTLDGGLGTDACLNGEVVSNCES